MERTRDYLLHCLWIIILCAAVGAAATRELYVKPSGTAACPSSTCYTLDHILQNPSQYLISNLTIFFLADIYEVSTKGQVVVTNVSNLAFVGSGRVGQPHSRIHCTKNFGLAFMKSKNVSVSNLSIERCGVNFTRAGLQELNSVWPSADVISAALTFVEIHSLNISGVSVTTPNGYGLLATNVFNCSVEGSTFSNSSSSGNLQLYYTPSNLYGKFFVRISSSQFMHGMCHSSSGYGCGLSIVLLQLAYSIEIWISNVTTSNNWAWNGANIFLYGKDCTNSSFRIENTVSMYGGGNRGTGLLFQWDSSNACVKQRMLHQIISIESSLFATNTAMQGSAVEVNTHTTLMVSNRSPTAGYHFVLRNSSIMFNKILIPTRNSRIFNFTGYGKALFQDVNVSHNSYSTMNEAEIERSRIEGYSHSTSILGVHNSDGRPFSLDCLNCIFIHNTNATVLELVNKNISVRFQGTTIFAQNINTMYRTILYLAFVSVHFNGTTKFLGNGKRGAIFVTFFSTLSFLGNTLFKGNMNAFKHGSAGAVGAVFSNVYFIGNTSFVENEAESGGAIDIGGQAHINVQGSMIFQNNQAKYGGAVFIKPRSFITLIPPARINFLHNSASVYGGGIYTFDVSTASFMCFIKLQQVNLTTDYIQMVFNYNKAGVAGSALFGGSLDQCLTVYNMGMSIYLGNQLSEYIFHFNSNNSDLSVVSSDPYRVCICEVKQPQCQILDYNTTVYPGEMLTLSLIAVGQMLGAIPATVLAKLLSEDSSEDLHSLREFQAAQYVSQPVCSALNYSILSDKQMEVLVLGVSSGHQEEELHIRWTTDVYKYWHHSVNVHITLLPCPPGFTLSTYPFECICTPSLKKAGIICNINTKSIHKPTHYWIAAAVNNGTNDAVVHHHCPYDFCISGPMDLNLEYPDEQCEYNRSGVLCGACQNHFSLALGTSLCLPCSNMYLLLALPFALAGIALVSVLILFNLTVSVGTLNGLIFYANIVRANQEILFPATANSPYRHILTTFIAWLNLDLGIETCFWDGLDAYGKVWLQLVFPVYIWAIIATVIVLSDRYIIAARLSGRNAVPVLATLFLLSYAKLLRLVVTALAYTTLEYPDGTALTVWLYDGNVEYLKDKHIPLFLLALVLLLFLSIPYTLVLLFAQCLQQKSSARPLFWVRKMKPLFDAYVGPYKDKHCYWGGLLLVTRAVLILVYALTSLGDPAVNLLANTVVVFSLTVVSLAVGGAYKQWTLTLLEYSFLLNLGILSAATLYTRQGDGNQVAVAYTLVTASLITFVGIFIYHIFTAIKNSRFLKQRQNHPIRMANIAQENDSSSDSDTGENKPVKYQELLFDDWREPVLKYCNDN